MTIESISSLCHPFFSLTTVALLLTGCVNIDADEEGVKKTNQIRPGIASFARPAGTVTVNVGVINEARELDLLKKILSGVNEIYQQCDISVLDNTQTIELSATQIIDRETRIQLSKQYNSASPTVFFVPSTNEADIAFAYLPSYDSPLASTSWITSKVSERCLAWITAHELGHVLLDSSEHSNSPVNVMNRGCKLVNWNNQAASPKWNPEQCAAFRRSPFFVH